MRVLLLDRGFTCEVDGPGQRLVWYLKGCNLRCPWCAAPESISPRPEVLVYPQRSDDRSGMAAACPYGAISETGERDRARCDACETLACANSGHPAFVRVGDAYTIEELLAQALRYQPFYGEDGGVTIGGGEPTCQFAAVEALLAGLKAAGQRTAMETNGTHPHLPELYQWLDRLYIDFKHPDDPAYHPAQVLANIRARYTLGQPLVVRIPLVPGVNADSPTLHQAGQALAAIGPLTVELLPLHRRGSAKCHALAHPMPDTLQPPTKKEIANARAILCGYGLTLVPSD